MPQDRVLYNPERLAKIATEAAKGDGVFSFKDRIGLVHDAFALSRAGFAEVSSALTVVDILKDEKECEFCGGGFLHFC
jgi:aminopeptidase 2